MSRLDDWIEGVHDPSAPFNQTEWTEQFSPIIDECDWITDEMLDDDDTYFKLGEVLTERVMPKYIDPEKYYPKGETYVIMTEKAKEIAQDFKKEYENSRQ